MYGLLTFVADFIMDFVTDFYLVKISYKVSNKEHKLNTHYQSSYRMVGMILKNFINLNQRASRGSA